jgi:hypothetical protein
VAEDVDSVTSGVRAATARRSERRRPEKRTCACLVNPDSQVIVQYAGDWNDPATGKEIALAEFEQKADIVFQIAGGTGVG